MGKRSFEYFCDNISGIENYDKAKADNFVGWDCQHRLETHNSDGERRLVDITAKELKALDIYYHRPANELVFIIHSEHTQLHKKCKPSGMKGLHHTNEARKKISIAHKGKHHSEETKNKISNANKGKRCSEEVKRKLSEAHKGKNTWTKGKHWKLVDGKRVYY